MKKSKDSTERSCLPPHHSPVFFNGINRRGYCAYCIHCMEARDSVEFAPECTGCKWTQEKPNWSPMPDFDLENAIADPTRPL